MWIPQTRNKPKCTLPGELINFGTFIKMKYLFGSAYITMNGYQIHYDIMLNEEARLKRQYTVWFHFNDILE